VTAVQIGDPITQKKNDRLSAGRQKTAACIERLQITARAVFLHQLARWQPIPAAAKLIYRWHP